MVTSIILIVIFIIYIGLGIPDSLLGSAWPAMYVDLGLDISNVSIVSFIINFGTVVSSFLSERIVKKFKIGPVATVSMALTVAALLGYSLSNNMIWLCLSAIPQGLGAGSIDVSVNNYVAKHYNASQMNFLHCFYGVGVAISPYLMSLFLRKNNSWQGGYRTMFYIQLVILIIVALALPLWKKADPQHYDKSLPKKKATPFLEIAKDRAVRVQWLIFIGSCSLEGICLVWGSTFLVESRGLSADNGAKMITLYYVGLTLGRVLSGLLVKMLKPEKVVYIGEATVFVACLIILVSPNAVVATVGLFLIGLGNGPVFPNMTQLTPEYFGNEKSEGIIGTQMGFAYIAFLATPLLFGALIKFFDLSFFSWYLLIFWFVMAASSFALHRIIKNKKH